jgi:uncharacterized Rmd1/YagE family protein
MSDSDAIKATQAFLASTGAFTIHETERQHRMSLELLSSKENVRVRALLVGERIDLRALTTAERLGLRPLVVRAGKQGCAVLFRYGAVVFFDVDAADEAAFLAELKPLVIESFPEPETEAVMIRADPTAEEREDKGVISLRDFSLERVQLIASILAKSVVLAHYEEQVAKMFDRVEPLAAELQEKGRRGYSSKTLLRDIGNALSVQHKMVGRVEVEEKPDLVWDRPDLDRLYVRLGDEYELRERHRALGRKFELISRTVETLLQLLQHRSTLRVEWYIVILIVVEILITVYERFLR